MRWGRESSPLPPVSLTSMPGLVPGGLVCPNALAACPSCYVLADLWSGLTLLIVLPLDLGLGRLRFSLLGGLSSESCLLDHCYA